MTFFPLDYGLIHFVGIGGIGMSGIAEVLSRQGHHCQGSDQNSNANTDRLRRLGINIAFGHKKQNVEDAAVVVRSSAVTNDNIEVMAARDLGIPVISRAEMLVELMKKKACIAVAGSHGKSTTTSMIAWILDQVGHDPTVVLGGILNAYGTNSRSGDGEWMVVEADESDGSFLLLPHQIAVITNIDMEHVDYYPNFAQLQEAFLRFAQQIPFYGANVVCEDDPFVKAMLPYISGKPLVRYGLSAEQGVSAEDIIYGIEGAKYTLKVNLPRQDAISLPVSLSLQGEHNVLNSLAALAVANCLGIDLSKACAALCNFSGVARRFSVLDRSNGVTIVDDYAHHPKEISEVIKAVRNLTYERVFVVFQPHRYSRLSHLWDDFVASLSMVDGVWLSPVYPAGEVPIPAATHYRLAEHLKVRGVGIVKTFDDPTELNDMLRPQLKKNDVVIFMGAGSITTWAHQFAEQSKE